MAGSTTDHDTPFPVFPESGQQQKDLFEALRNGGHESSDQGALFDNYTFTNTKLVQIYKHLLSNEGRGLFRQNQTITSFCLDYYVDFLNASIAAGPCTSSVLIIPQSTYALFESEIRASTPILNRSEVTSVDGKQFRLTMDIFNQFDKIIVVKHTGGCHYVTVGIYPQHRQIRLYDSLHTGSGWRALTETLELWLEDYVGIAALPTWKVNISPCGMQQAGGAMDCGANAAMTARLLAFGRPPPDELISTTDTQELCAARQARGRRFRIIMSLELLAGQINPADLAINEIERRIKRVAS